jgi:hypothetical protein
MELDPGIHIVMLSVLFLKPGVTLSSFRGPVQCSRPAPNESARPAQV